MTRDEKVAAVEAALQGRPFEGGYMAAARPTWLQRLFPARFAERPEDCGHYMNTAVEAHFDWIDRLRILVSGRVSVDIIIQTDVMVSQARSTVAAWVRPPQRRTP